MTEDFTKRKFVIGVIGRSGMTVYALLLEQALNIKLSIRGKGPHHVHFAKSDLALDWNFAINHTHNYDHFVNAPKDVERIWARRNYLDMAVSIFVARQTKVFNIQDQEQADAYKQSWQEVRFHYPVNELVDYLNDLKDMSMRINNHVVTNTEIITHQLFYSKHAFDITLFYQTLGISVPAYRLTKLIKLPHDKFLMIENFSEVLRAYQNFHCDFDVDKSYTLKKYAESI